jgi:hypothetical protein
MTMSAQFGSYDNSTYKFNPFPPGKIIQGYYFAKQAFVHFQLQTQISMV